jgi:hypothetical protein
VLVPRFDGCTRRRAYFPPSENAAPHEGRVSCALYGREEEQVLFRSPFDVAVPSQFQSTDRPTSTRTPSASFTWET